MRTTSMHFVNSLRSYLSSKVENRLLGMNERNYSLGDTFTVAEALGFHQKIRERRNDHKIRKKTRGSQLVLYKNITLFSSRQY